MDLHINTLTCKFFVVIQMKMVGNVKSQTDTTTTEERNEVIRVSFVQVGGTIIEIENNNYHIFLVFYTFTPSVHYCGTSVWLTQRTVWL